MNEDYMMKKAVKPVEKNRRPRSRPARIRHLQKQQRLWMASKVQRRTSGKHHGCSPLLSVEGSSLSMSRPLHGDILGGHDVR